MNTVKNDLFIKRCREYFGEDAGPFLELLEEPCTKGFFLNERKTSAEKILSLIDFPYEASDLTSSSFYHQEENIGKSLVYDLGLIYPQEIAASLPSSLLKGKETGIILDLCAAPGGKSINILNRVKADLLISNDVSYKRALTMSSNFERLGLSNVLITSKKPEELSCLLKGSCDIVLLDAPCSGEGMLRKYPEILDTYSLSNIEELSGIQKELLENAYECLKEDGILVYSTCTYAFEEDEDQIRGLLARHPDMELIPSDITDNHSSIPGCVKLSPLNHTEGQFFAILKRTSRNEAARMKHLKEVKDREVQSFIEENLDLTEYHLYRNKDAYYLSLTELPDLGSGVIRMGVMIGEKGSHGFEPSHALYRSNELRPYFRYVYELNDDEYRRYINGQELSCSIDDHYYLLTYKGLSAGFGRARKGRLKNKYPKGLRRML